MVAIQPRRERGQAVLPANEWTPEVVGRYRRWLALARIACYRGFDNPAIVNRLLFQKWRLGWLTADDRHLISDAAGALVAIVVVWGAWIGVGT